MFIDEIFIHHACASDLDANAVRRAPKWVDVWSPPPLRTFNDFARGDSLKSGVICGPLMAEADFDLFTAA
jgi:hypothetical protein